MIIEGFRNQYRWLSNFSIAPVVYEGMCFRTVEHAYQAAKSLDWDEREYIQAAWSAGEAKRRGKKVKIREDWDSMKLHVMELLLQQKFAVEPYRSMLIATGAAEIIHDNWRPDRYWGVCRGKGENNLGKLIMRVRDGLR
jgi:hypothetical protein